MKKLRLNTQYIDFCLQQRNISKKEFCNLCGIKRSTLNSVYQQKNVTIDKIVPIVDLLKITINTFCFLEKTKKTSNR